MKFPFKGLLVVCSVACTLASCHDNSSQNHNYADTTDKIQADTSAGRVITGTPGPSGSEPKPGDTTKAHNDSLKAAKAIADTSTSGSKH